MVFFRAIDFKDNFSTRQRATILKRHFVAQWRQQQRRQLDRFSKPSRDDVDADARKEVDGKIAAAVAPTQNDAIPVDKKSSQRTFSSPATMTSAAQGLARLGSRTALSFAFAFLRRAWRSGEDADLCSDLLQVGFLGNGGGVIAQQTQVLQARITALEFFAPN